MRVHLFTTIFIVFLLGCKEELPHLIELNTGAHISLIGGNLCARMMNYGHFETEMNLRFPESKLVIRNMCDGGDTPGFRAHAGRVKPWAFPGAKKYYSALAKDSDSRGQFPTPDEWLANLNTDVIIACFGFSESFRGPAGLDNFSAELNAFVEHTSSEKYNGTAPPKLILVSPLAFEDLSAQFDLPNGKDENANLKRYTNAIREVALKNNIPFLDIFEPSSKWLSGSNNLTIDGSQLNQEGNEILVKYLVNKIFGEGEKVLGKNSNEVKKRQAVSLAVQAKNWTWFNDYKSPNGVHAFGRRFQPYGSENYPREFKKLRAMTANRDQAIWAAAQGKVFDLAAADRSTPDLVETKTNVDSTLSGGKYLYGQDALNTIQVAQGFNIELFASEKEFPDLANPVQLSFDDNGRLWVAVIPTYPHHKPGDPMPNDKLLILEDTDGNGKADKQTVFVDGLHLPMGFELAPEGVYISQGTNLKLYSDTDGDDHADTEEIIFSGFDDHDTHHVISAFSADPAGGIIMEEGVFLYSNIETSYGTIRSANAGFFRYDSNRKKLDRIVNATLPNPWGVTFDEWGQCFYLQTSGPNMYWMLPSTIQPKYADFNPLSPNLIEEDHLVRPTSGIEVMSSRHFPEAMQQDIILNNCIGFLGTKQHRIQESGTGYSSQFIQDLIKSSDPNFRLVDMEVAPDGSLYFADWHNKLIGHMQHSARDPLRDHAHGRIYRLTYPSRPLVTPAKIAGASIETLLEHLKLPEYRSRYRSRRALRGENREQVAAKLNTWVLSLDSKDRNHERYLTEALWVSWGIDKLDTSLLDRLLHAEHHQARTAAVEALRYHIDRIPKAYEWIKNAANDKHGRVRLAALTAASYLENSQAEEIYSILKSQPEDKWITPSLEKAIAHVSGEYLKEKPEGMWVDNMSEENTKLYIAGKEIYEREGFCTTCHQSGGGGLSAANYPPLINTKWVTQSPVRLIKLTLNGLYGPITVLDKDYLGNVPMTAFGGMLSDEEVAAVLTYVRNSFGNRAEPIQPAQVTAVRKATADKTGFYSPEELLSEHPHSK